VFTIAITKQHIRFSIYFAFHLKKNAAEATAYGENAVNHTTCKRWYQKFRQEDFSLENEPRAERFQKIETDELQALLNINSEYKRKLKRSLQNLLAQFGVMQ